ncbi:heterokaryon incompatibility protein-domain-containing protein [Apiospora rasikravindrae]|uniref:Heterokaryon incompatibility protein-domain-containing protein n=1 Tax=Apiospora rasikravindrae TaxID=990691 RepID=A0ABR1RPQ6_9PEZI
MDTLADDEFRVLSLLPGEKDEPLRCELLTRSLADHPPYEALSYVWSINPAPAHLELEGQPVAITEGLEDILFRLRYAAAPRTLWIDRLCINQSDTAEKSAQVSRMRAIYSSCTRALLWMGELEEETQIADAGAGVSVLEYIAAFDPGTDSDSETGSEDSDTDSNSDAASNTDTSAGSETDPNRETSPKEAVIVPVPECAKSEEAFRAAMTALGLISPRKGPWWHRVWTVQEAMLPSDAVFLWGPFSISGETMEVATRAWIQTSDYEESLTPSQCGMLHDPGYLGSLMANVIWMGYDNEIGEPPLPTAIKWRTRSATMPVDKVYALTGLNVAGVLPRSEKCDYSLGLKQVYINFTLDLIHRDGDGGDLQPLVIDPRREPDNETDSEGGLLPRWAVDMRSFPKYDTVPWRQHHFYSRFEANRGLPRDYPPQYDGEALQLSGVTIDTITEVGEGHHVEVDGTNEYPPVRPILRAWWTLYCKTRSLDVTDDVLYCGLEPGNCEAYDRFCRLVLGDVLGDDDDQTPLEEEVSLPDRQDVARHLRTGEPIEHLRVSIGRTIKNRRFFVTVGGLLGLGHLETEPGDEVWVFSHGRVPFTLRPRRRGGEGEGIGGQD